MHFYDCEIAILTLTLAKIHLLRMALFQQSVLKKHLHDLNKEQLQQAWSRFTTQFHDPVKQQNIRNAKEEQYQEGFLRELFVEVLGYTLNPSPGFNLTTEYKNEKDSKKADGAVLKAEAVTAVIELKGTDTTDLGKVETQAFSYKNNQKGCTYVITSNFEKLRFYINDAVDHLEFNLFTLTEKEFAVLFCCLQADALLNDTALKMKQASITVEENVTKQLYSDYSGFKRKLFHSIASLNTQYDQLTLFKKTQKLLDRFLFILFAEDRLLVPPNSVREILKDWEHLNEMDNYVPLYDRFKKYFGYLNNGYEGKKYEIFAYNGGLFAPDEILDNVKIEDELLYDATKQLSQYDFETEVDVNILGHIFEHSLTEIEEVERELSTAADAPVIPTQEGSAEQSTKPKTSKRKKDGVFYTPRYITKYIVVNTVGALCNSKKEELEITDDAFTPQKRKDNTRKLQQKLETYRQWLLQLTICDPACGSGAFLNQALEFLIAEHRYVDTLTAKLFGDTMVLSDVENSILENNLFGVDINEEAVEIARLSLWLRTARKGRKLNNLNNNIKAGNSLIDDPAVAGDKAFKWENEFATIFEKGGFDVVLGNPPYGASFNEDEKNFIIKYETYKYKFESYVYFFEKGIQLLNPTGILGYITPELWLNLENCEPLRKYIFDNSNLFEINIIGENIFNDAVVNTIISILYKNRAKDSITIISSENKWEIKYDDWGQSRLMAIEYRISSRHKNIIATIETTSKRLHEFGEVIQGITPYDKYKGQDPDLIKRRGYHFDYKKDETCGHWLNGEDINRYSMSWSGEWLSYGSWLGAPREKRFFEGNRILFREIPGKSRRIQAAITNEISYYGHSITPFILFDRNDMESLKAILCVVNSSLISWYGNLKLPNFGKEVFPKLNPQDIKLLPIHEKLFDRKNVFVDKANLIISKNDELAKLMTGFLKLLSGKFEKSIKSRKLDNWPSFTFKEFLKELDKQKIKLSLSEQSEWMTYFEAEKAKANQLQQLIVATDKEIDRMVYALYELTDEEIKIVEGNK